MWYLTFEFSPAPVGGIHQEQGGGQYSQPVDSDHEQEYDLDLDDADGVGRDGERGDGGGASSRDGSDGGGGGSGGTGRRSDPHMYRHSHLFGWVEQPSSCGLADCGEIGKGEDRLAVCDATGSFPVFIKGCSNGADTRTTMVPDTAPLLYYTAAAGRGSGDGREREERQKKPRTDAQAVDAGAAAEERVYIYIRRFWIVTEVLLLGTDDGSSDSFVSGREGTTRSLVEPQA